MKKLVEQTLDPMVSAYFKNIGQKMTPIALLQNRAAIQEESANEMTAKFEAYSLELQEVLIGTPRASQGDETIENILIQRRSRQVARERITTDEERRRRPCRSAPRTRRRRRRRRRSPQSLIPGQGARERRRPRRWRARRRMPRRRR